MPSSYLFLSSAQRDGLKWNNLPTLSQSTRECYLTIIDATITFAAVLEIDTVKIKMVIPSSNYFSSDNESPIVAFMDSIVVGGEYIYKIPPDNMISILTNDNLKSVEFILEDDAGNSIDFDDDAGNRMSVMIKLDYVDQDAMVNQVLLEYPKHL